MSGKLLNEFYEKLSKGESRFTPAFRPLFKLWFSFGRNHTDVGTILNLSDYSSRYLDDISYLVRSIDLPNFQMDSEDSLEIKNIVGSFKGPGKNDVMPESNNFSITFLDTETSALEYFFVPWLEHTLQNDSSNTVYPFLRATIYVDCFSNTGDKVIMRYCLFGCYPNHVDSPNLTYGANADQTRTVGFEFNKVNVKGNFGKNDKIRSQQDIILSNLLERARANTLALRSDTNNVNREERSATG